MVVSSKVPVAILISGRGTNMLSLARATKEGRLDADIRCVISNRSDAAGLAHAQALGIPTMVMSHRDFPSREEYDAALAGKLLDLRVEWVVLAGFMRILTTGVLGPFAGRVINIHPALLPAFPGIHSQKQALDYGVKFSGCTVHFVDEGTDTGAIIAQDIVEVRDDDDEDSLAVRILERENILYPKALQDVISGRIIVEGRRTRTVEDTRC